MSLSRQQTVFLQHVAELIRKASEYGLLVTAGELYRTPEQQALHVRNGRSRTMNSQHLKRLAIDLNFFQETPDGSLKLVHDGDSVRQLGVFWESLDPVNRWGGNWSNFKDLPHFERRDSPVTAAGEVVRPASFPPVPAPELPTRGKGLLAGTVGFRCRNDRYDVESVQRLINLNAGRFTLETSLKCDGIIGEKTLEAIRAFQRRVLGVTDPDGTINPGDPTLLALCISLPRGIDATLLSLTYLNASDESAGTFAPHIEKTMTRYDINTPLRQAHFLAQVGHESGELRFRRELADGTAYENRRDLGNTQPGDGPRYKGRGLIQLTGRANYAEYSHTSSLDIDVEANPDIVASDDGICADVAGWFWNHREINLLADRDDLEGVTRRINGGLNGLSDRRRLLSRTKTLLGV